MTEEWSVLIPRRLFLQAAGLHPTADQIELFAYHLPNATLSNLIVNYFSRSNAPFVCCSSFESSNNYFFCCVLGNLCRYLQSGRFAVLHVQHRRLQIPRRHHSTCPAGAEDTLHFLLCSNQSKTALRLQHVSESNSRLNISQEIFWKEQLTVLKSSEVSSDPKNTNSESFCD